MSNSADGASLDDEWAADTISNVSHSAEAALTERDLEALDAVQKYLREEDEDFEQFEEKMDELNEGLLKAYCAGFAKAKDVYDIEQGPYDFRSLMNTQAVAENHHYFWDGRTKPLELWLLDEFGLADGGEDSE